MTTPLFLASVISWKFRLGALVIVGLAGWLMWRALKSDQPAVVRPASWIERLLYGATVLGGSALALTGLGMVILLGDHLAGWPLLLHCTAAPLFAIGLAGFGISAADRFGTSTPGDKGSPIEPLLFWLALLAGMTVMLSVALPMLPFFDTVAQEHLIKVHRYAGLACVAFILPHAGRVVRVW